MGKNEDKFARLVKTLEEKIEKLEQKPDAKELVENLQKELAELKDRFKQDQSAQTILPELEELKVKLQELEGYLKSGAKFVNGEWRVPEKEKEPAKEPETVKEPKAEPENDWFL